MSNIVLERPVDRTHPPQETLDNLQQQRDQYGLDESYQEFLRHNTFDPLINESGTGQSPWTRTSDPDRDPNQG